MMILSCTSTAVPRVAAAATVAVRSVVGVAVTHRHAISSTRCCLMMSTRAASAHDLAGLAMTVTTAASDKGHHTLSYYDDHRPKASIQRTMSPSTTNSLSKSTKTRSYGTTLQLTTSFDEPSGRATWESPLRHYALEQQGYDGDLNRGGGWDPLISAAAAAGGGGGGGTAATTPIQASVATGSGNEWHGYVPSESPATTEDGGDMMLDAPSAAAEVAMMIDTSYYHASYQSSHESTKTSTKE